MLRAHTEGVLPEVSAAHAQIRVCHGPELPETVLPVQLCHGLSSKRDHGHLSVSGVQNRRVQRITGPVCGQHQGQPVTGYHRHTEQRAVPYGADQIQPQGAPSVQGDRRVSAGHQDENKDVRPGPHAAAHRQFH